MSNPRTPHMVAAKHLLIYLKQSPCQRLFFSSKFNLQLQVFCDFDWGRCLDTRRSISSFFIFLGHSLVSWRSKKQPIIARCSTEVEYKAMASTTCETTWLKQLLKDFDVIHKVSALMFCDNDDLIKIDTNRTFHERTKHIEIDCHFVREKGLDPTVRLMPIRSVF